MIIYTFCRLYRGEIFNFTPDNSDQKNEINIDIIKIIYLWKCIFFLKWTEIGLHLQLDYLPSEVIIRSTLLLYRTRPLITTFVSSQSAIVHM